MSQDQPSDFIKELRAPEVEKKLRITNYILDLIFVNIFSFIIGFIIGSMLVIINPDFIYMEDEMSFLDLIIGIISLFLYYLLTEGLMGRSIAKFITGTKVVDMDDNPPKLGTIAIRTLCRMIPSEAFSFLGQEARGWHDSISKTKVISAKHEQL